MDELGNDMDSTANRLDVVQVKSVLLHAKFILELFMHHPLLSSQYICNFVLLAGS